jgi:hypothetical protein
MTALLADRVADVILTLQEQGTMSHVHAWVVLSDRVPV